MNCSRIATACVVVLLLGCGEPNKDLMPTKTKLNSVGSAVRPIDGVQDAPFQETPPNDAMFSDDTGGQPRCWPTMQDGIYYECFNNLVIDFEYFGPVLKVSLDETGDREFRFSLTSRELPASVVDPLNVDVAVRIRKRYESEKMVEFIVGSMQIGPASQKKEFQVDYDSFARFLELDYTRDKKFHHVCYEIGIYYRGLGDAVDQQFKSIIVSSGGNPPK